MVLGYFQVRWVIFQIRPWLQGHSGRNGAATAPECPGTACATKRIIFSLKHHSRSTAPPASAECGRQNPLNFTGRTWLFSTDFHMTFQSTLSKSVSSRTPCRVLHSLGGDTPRTCASEWSLSLASFCSNERRFHRPSLTCDS